MRKINISNFTNVNDKQHKKNEKIILFGSDSKTVIYAFMLFLLLIFIQISI
jgi:hypothetical protein